MKKTVLTVGIAMLFVLGSAAFIGCGNSENHESENHDHNEGHDNGDGHSHDHSPATEESSVEINDEFNGEKVKDLSLIIDSYLQLKNALVKDNGSEAAEAANKMLSAFNGFDEASLTETKTTEYAEIKESAVENAEHIVKNANVIDHQREHLVVLSEDINDLITLIGTDRKLYRDYCPMADNNNGAIWISETEEISNPYMGSKMPKCGKIEQEIN